MISLDATAGALRPHPSWSRDLQLHGRDFASLASDLLPPLDFASLLLAAWISTLLYALLFPDAPLQPGALTGRGNVALIGAVLAPFLLYDREFAAAASRNRIAALIFSYTCRCLLIATIAFVIGMTSEVLDNLPQLWVAIWLTTSLILTATTRVVVARHMRVAQHRGALTESIAIVGAGPAVDKLMRQLQQGKADSIELLGNFSDAGAVGGTVDDLLELGRTRAIDWILVAPPEDEERLQDIVQRLRVLPARIGLCPHVGLPLACHRVDYAGDGMPVLLVAERPIQRWDAVIKAVEDVVLGGILLLLLLPVLALIALLIRLDGPGPVLFRQRRHAFNNNEFDIYKFRTMRGTPPAPDGDLQQTRRNDDRVTPIGRFLRASSLDELPQLLNVIRGEMSLVGPRPHAVNMRTENRLGSEITDLYAHRHRVKPGMTGWSQVNGARGATETRAQLQRRVELDLYYIDHWSLWLDLKILLLTCREVLKGTNAF